MRVANELSDAIVIWIAGEQDDTTPAAGDRDDHIIPEVAPLEFRMTSAQLGHHPNRAAGHDIIGHVRNDDSMRLQTIYESTTDGIGLALAMRTQEPTPHYHRVKIDHGHEPA